MHLSYLREYVVLARYMNISKASRELNMTQSNLSKHIRQIELEAVSYTHLDVYKRQTPASTRERRWR